MNFSDILLFIQDPYFIVVYFLGFGFSFVGMLSLFSYLIDMKTKEYIYTVLAALVFPLSVLVLVFFSISVAFFHIIKIVFKKN